MRCAIPAGCLGAAFLLLLEPAATLAGMPSPTLTDWAFLRIETLSFCLAVFLLSTAVIRGLWNWLARDFPRMPRLTYAKTLAAVCLWGLLLGVVLTMIAGARELLTPGAWQRDGLLYRLAAPQPTQLPSESPRIARRLEQLRELRAALWQYAARHEGRFPASDRASGIAEPLWEVPGGAGMRYLYVPGLAADASSAILVYEPAVYDQQRFALQTNGEPVLMTTEELRRRLAAERNK